MKLSQKKSLSTSLPSIVSFSAITVLVYRPLFGAGGKIHLLLLLYITKAAVYFFENLHGQVKEIEVLFPFSFFFSSMRVHLLLLHQSFLLG